MSARCSKSGSLRITPSLGAECVSSDEILIGEWLCTARGLDSDFSHNHQSIAYHWNDREKLKNDVERIKVYVDLILESLPAQLNAVLGRNRSNEYWKMITSEWVFLF